MREHKYAEMKSLRQKRHERLWAIVDELMRIKQLPCKVSELEDGAEVVLAFFLGKLDESNSIKRDLDAIEELVDRGMLKEEPSP